MIIEKIKSSNGYRAKCECDWCGKGFEKQYYSAKRSSKQFCSMGCIGKWKSKYHSGKNSSIYGRKYSEEHRRNISEVKKGRKLSEETKSKISETLKGRMAGEKNPMYGKTFTEEHRRKLSESLLGNKRTLGFKHSEDAKKNMSEAQKRIDRVGKKNPMWNGGIKIHNGYVQIYKPNHPNTDVKGYVLEHRLVMEEHLGRYLRPEEVVHHENGITDDNRIENLRLFKNESAHTGYHNKLRTKKKQKLNIG